MSEQKATVQVKTVLKNETPSGRRVTLITTLFDAQKQHVGEEKTVIELPANGTKEVALKVQVQQPSLWSPENPYLYEARCTVAEGDEEKDCVTQSFGIRTIEYSAEKGLLLNGKKIILNGGCLHHDNGFLGSAAFDRAEERKVELMKAAGFNAARTAHNVPSEAFLMLATVWACWSSTKPSTAGAKARTSSIIPSISTNGGSATSQPWCFATATILPFSAGASETK